MVRPRRADVSARAVACPPPCAAPLASPGPAPAPAARARVCVGSRRAGASVAGTLLDVRPSFIFGGETSPRFLKGVYLQLAAAVLAAGAMLCVRYIGKRESPLVIAAWFQGMSCLTSAAVRKGAGAAEEAARGDGKGRLMGSEGRGGGRVRGEGKRGDGARTPGMARGRRGARDSAGGDERRGGPGEQAGPGGGRGRRKGSEHTLERARAGSIRGQRGLRSALPGVREGAREHARGRTPRSAQVRGRSLVRQPPSDKRAHPRRRRRLTRTETTHQGAALHGATRAAPCVGVPAHGDRPARGRAAL